jgi:hypothetical protein
MSGLGGLGGGLTSSRSAASGETDLWLGLLAPPGMGRTGLRGSMKVGLETGLGWHCPARSTITTATATAHQTQHRIFFFFVSWFSFSFD